MQKRPFERSFAVGNAMEFSDVLLEPSEAAAFLKVSISWLAKARATNDGPICPDWSLRSVQQGRASPLAEVAGAVTVVR
jgi:hypothetical protein